MNFFKKIIATFFLLTAMMSTSVLANEKVDSNAVVKAAGETTITKVEEALNLAANGGDKAAIMKLLGEVRQAQKEFRYEQTERLRQKAGDKLKVARDEIAEDKGNCVEALKATLALYKEMMTVYQAAH